jgi:hypothetical protein
LVLLLLLLVADGCMLALVTLTLLLIAGACDAGAAAEAGA